MRSARSTGADVANRIELAREFVQREFVDRGMVADLNVHWDIGADGEANAPHRGVLRRAENRITDAHGPWLRYVFDCDSRALPLEGAIAGGDSGGPVLIKIDGKWTLAGVTHGLDGSLGDVLATRTGTFKQGVCGQTFASTRMSFFANWISDNLRSVPKSKKAVQ